MATESAFQVACTVRNAKCKVQSAQMQTINHFTNLFIEGLA